MRLASLAPLAFAALTSCAALEYAPVAAEVADTVFRIVARHQDRMGTDPKRMTCEEEYHPGEKQLLILCEVRF